MAEQLQLFLSNEHRRFTVDLGQSAQAAPEPEMQDTIEVELEVLRAVGEAALSPTVQMI